MCQPQVHTGMVMEKIHIKLTDGGKRFLESNIILVLSGILKTDLQVHVSTQQMCIAQPNPNPIPILNQPHNDIHEILMAMLDINT